MTICYPGGEYFIASSAEECKKGEYALGLQMFTQKVQPSVSIKCSAGPFPAWISATLQFCFCRSNQAVKAPTCL